MTAFTEQDKLTIGVALSAMQKLVGDTPEITHAFAALETAWERVPDGTYVTKHGDGIISYGGDQLSVSKRQKRMTIFVGTLPDGWELRRRVKKEPTNANP